MYGTSKYIISSIINNNIANGLTTTGTIMNNQDEKIYHIDSVTTFNIWWKNKYGNSDIGNDHTYIVMIFH